MLDCINDAGSNARDNNDNECTQAEYETVAGSVFLVASGGSNARALVELGGGRDGRLGRDHVGEAALTGKHGGSLLYYLGASHLILNESRCLAQMPDRLGWYSDVPYPFWQEESGWPYVHFANNLIVYLAVPHSFVVLTLAYAFESFEQLLSRSFAPQLREARWDDSWLGDPLMSVLAIAVLAPLDQLLAVPAALPPPLLRLLYAVLAAGPTLAIGNQGAPRTRLLGHAVWTIALTALVYGLYAETLADAIRILVPSSLWLSTSIASLPSVRNPDMAAFKRVFLLGATASAVILFLLVLPACSA